MHQPTLYRLVPVLIAAAPLTGCLSNATPSSSAPPIDQTHICQVSDWQHDSVAGQCKPGQKVAFLPNSWGNEQLPILFAAVNCDLRYGIVSTKGAVTCIYGPITPEPAASQKPDSEKTSPAK